MTTHRRTGLARVGLSTIIAGLLLAIIGLASPAAASVEDPDPEPYEGNADCETYGYTLEFKINAQPENGTYEEGDSGIETKGVLQDDLYVTISNVEHVDGRLEFDWSSNYAWSLVLVKQADGGLAYEYNPAVTGDQDVQTVEGDNEGGISHVTFCNPTTPPPPPPETCPEGTTWVDANENQEVDEGECQPPEETEPELAAAIACGVPSGMKVIITNTGGGDGTVDITSNDVVVHDEVLVPAGGSVERIVDAAEDAAYDIEVVGVQGFTGTRDCVQVEGVVVPKTPEKPAVQVQAQQLPATGDNDLAMAMVGLGLILVGAGALLVSKDHATA